jgi:plasmanylethanolamine desaturase
VTAVDATLLADLVSGLVHWIEDTFWTENSPIVGKWIVTPNSLHHRDGFAFTKCTWWQSSWDLVFAGLLIVAIAWLLHDLSWYVVLFTIAGANANQVHKWSHMAQRDVPALVRVLQKYHVLQSPGHHAGHHRGEWNTRFCVITDVLNPLLDRSRFWRALEALLVPVFGAPRRFDVAESLRAIPGQQTCK